MKKKLKQRKRNSLITPSLCFFGPILHTAPSKISISKVLAVKPNQNLFNAIGVQSIRPYASFDTHIAISKNDKRQMAYALNMAFLAFLT